MENILAIDPGREKCGLAVLSAQKRCLERKTASSTELAAQVLGLFSKFKISLIAIGNGTSAREIQKELLKLNLAANMIFVPEKNSSLEARRRYWQTHKPKGLWKLIPTSLRIPPVAIDDFAAQILGERFLNQKA